MINKQSYIIPSTLKNITIKLQRNQLNNDQRLSNMEDDRYLINSYSCGNNFGKFFKTRYSDFFSFLNIPVQYPEEDF